MNVACLVQLCLCKKYSCTGSECVRVCVRYVIGGSNLLLPSCILYLDLKIG